MFEINVLLIMIQFINYLIVSRGKSQFISGILGGLRGGLVNAHPRQRNFTIIR
jgi:hypothetical protein